MARATRGTAVVGKGNTTTITATGVVVSGSNTGILFFVVQRRSTTETITSIVRDGQSATRHSTDYTVATAYRVNIWKIVGANTGTADAVLTQSAGRNCVVIAVPFSNLDTTTPFGTVTEEADLSTVYGASVTADQELLAFAAAYDAAAAAGSFTPTGTGQTEIADDRQNDQYGAVAYQQETGTVTASWTFGAATADNTANFLVSVNGAVSGPTVTVQPTAQTARLNGEPAPTATFTSTATGTGTVDATAEIESGVGSGTYGTLANGSGATWSGLTGTGSGSATATPVGTFTAVTLSGRRIRIKFEDDNGTTYSDAVALTVLTGPVVTGGSTNGSGVLATNLTSDDALTANGEVLLVTDTDTLTSTVVGRTTTRPA